MSGVKAIYVGQIVYTTYVAMCIVYICTYVALFLNLWTINTIFTVKHFECV